MLVLSSCGQSFVGKWQAKEVKKDGMTSNSDYEKDTGLPVGSAYQLEIKEDGTGTVKKISDLDADKIEWKVSDGKLQIYLEGLSDVAAEFCFEGDALATDDVGYLGYGVYVSQTAKIDSVICERVDSFYNTTDMRRYTLSRVAKYVWTAVSSTLSDLKNSGRFTEIPYSYFSYNLKYDEADSELKKVIYNTLNDEGFTDCTVKLEMSNNINSCTNLQITDASGITGEFDSEEFAKALGIRDNY